MLTITSYFGFLLAALTLGSLSWAGHQIHVSLPINQFLDAGVIVLISEFVYFVVIVLSTVRQAVYQ